jgi:hypothetical protein
MSHLVLTFVRGPVLLLTVISACKGNEISAVVRLYQWVKMNSIMCAK